MRLIDKDMLIEILGEMQGLCGTKAALIQNSKIWQQVKDLPAVDAVPVIRCKGCKHRPVYDEQKREMPPRMEVEYDDDGEPWVWDDDMTCPYLCGDSYYNQMPDDEQFCDRGERKEE